MKNDPWDMDKIRDAARQRTLEALNNQILLLPSGPRRNVLTGLNILFVAAMQATDLELAHMERLLGEVNENYAKKEATNAEV